MLNFRNINVIRYHKEVSSDNLLFLHFVLLNYRFLSDLYPCLLCTNIRHLFLSAVVLCIYSFGKYLVMESF